MLRNYIKIAFRSLWKNKVYAAINIIGLAIGLACVLVITVYVQLELSYDKYHDDYEDIYRVTQQWINDGVPSHSATTQAPAGQHLSGNLSSVNEVVRIFPNTGFVSIDQQDKIKEDDFCFVDSTFFDVFTAKFINGNPETALDDPFSVVLTQSMAIRYFGETNILNKELFYEDERKTFSFNVTGVIEDFRQNSHYEINFLGSFSSLNTIMPWYDNWYHPPMYTYIKAQPNSKPDFLDEQVNEFLTNKLPDYEKGERSFSIQKLSDIHLRSSLDEEWQANSSYSYISMFMLVACFILIIACINFMNLSTAQSARRSQEVGLRKVMGADRKQLIRQFLGESLFTTFISFVIAFGMAELVLEFIFNAIIQKELSLLFLLQWPNWFYAFGTLIMISILAGIYPAFYLSAFRPAKTIKGENSKAGGAKKLRMGLVVFQFFISCILIIGTVIIVRQVSFLRNKKLGFDKDLVVAVKMVDRYAQDNYLRYVNSLANEAGVLETAMSNTIPGRSNFITWEIEPEGIKSEKEMVMKSLGVDEDFLKTYNIPIVQGREFSKIGNSDSLRGFILNEAAVKRLGWEDEPIGKKFAMYYHTDKRTKKEGEIIGVVKNFHFESLHQQIEPLVLFINKHPYYTDYVSVRLASDNWQSSINLLERKWNEFHPEKPFDFTILDEELETLYHAEVRTGKVFLSFAVLSIVVSCLGLFGLSAFSAQQRTKEIGIRKVLGAGVVSILKLLSKEYVILILISNLIAWPLAWYLSTLWLNNFAYRITVGLELFAFTLVIALIISVVTVSFQSIKAAIMNPVKSLRQD